MRRAVSAELNNTSWVILGLLKLAGEKTGYEIKALVDSSTQYFWPASYGRIYPELHRLREQGLVTSRDDPHGGRPRTLYALTDTGEQALREWLANPGELVFELRDEGILRLFLGQAARRDHTLASVRAMRAHHDRLTARLREFEPFVRDAFPEGHPLIALEGGIEFHSWYADFCQRMEERIRALPSDAQETP